VAEDNVTAASAAVEDNVTAASPVAEDKAAVAESAVAQDEAATAEAAADHATPVDVVPAASPDQRKSQRRRKPAKDKVAPAAEPAIGQAAQADVAPTVVAPDQQEVEPRRELAEDTAPAAAVGEPAPGDAVSTASPEQQEIERRRELVRTLFNSFWDGSDDKPATFADRLNQAEAYLNEQLKTRGESWRLDANTRKMLGLPPRGH
jgi:hypothetical protein